MASSDEDTESEEQLTFPLLKFLESRGGGNAQGGGAKKFFPKGRPAG